MNNPIAVLISDVHYNINTLKLADAAMRMAINKANELNVPLIVAGDLHDTKANMRGECVNAMIETFKLCKNKPYILVGNHDKINEKSEEHSLNFLDAYATVVNRFRYPKSHSTVWRFALACYHHNIEELRRYIKNHSGRIIIMHQGLIGSDGGEYIQDKTALNPQDVAGKRIISGHYHRRQTIQLPCGGTWDYIGNPYTLGFGEATDPPKGFQILMSDGSLEFVPTNLREHRIMEGTVEDLAGEWLFLGEPEDLVWVKLHGTKAQLANITKATVASQLDIIQPFRLDLIPTDTPLKAPDASTKASKGELIDQIIDSLVDATSEQIARLKAKWRGMAE